MATGGSIDVQQRVRVSDIANEPQKMLMPIRGYEKMPLVSLEEAVAPLASILPEVQDYAYVAKQRCEDEPADGLTKDESASIMLYSMEWEPHEECLYFSLNATLRAEDRRKLKPWFLYLKLVLTALEKLPSKQRVVYRGINIDLSNVYAAGKTFIWWGFSSCTASLGVLENEQFLAKAGERTLFTIHCDSGKDISRHSYYASEKEILLLAARQFTVESCLRPAPGLHMVQIQETRSPITLLPQAINEADKIKPPSSSEVKKIQAPVHSAGPSKPTNETKYTKPKKQEFAEPNAFKELACNGRHCATCGKCRDWYYTGDKKTWEWIRSVTNWSGDNLSRWRSDKLYQRFNLRDGATCHLSYVGHHSDHLYVGVGLVLSYVYLSSCVCEDNTVY